MTLWHPVDPSFVEGKGWKDTELPFDRLPLRAKKTVPEKVWELSHSSTGMCFQFITDASELFAKWDLALDQLGEPFFGVTGFSGLDFYAWDDGRWKWAASCYQHKDRHPELSVLAGIAPGRRRWMCYLPLRNQLEGISIGVPEGAHFELVPVREEKPVVFYGTSIVHGAYASRAGLTHTAILGRRLRVPFVNLGFSGNARMEIELADLIAEIDARIYVLDCLPNMNAEMVRERAVPFVERLAAKRPATPILMAEDRVFTNAWIRPAVNAEHEERHRFHREAFLALRDKGLFQVHSLDGASLWGDDHEASFDSVHPGDLGYWRQAEAMEPVIRRLTGLN